MLVTITVALAAVAVLAAIVVVAVGGGGELSAEHPDHPPLALLGRRVVGTDAALLRLPLGLWGYHKQITDEALERFAHELTERDTRIAILEQQLAEARQRLHEGVRGEPSTWQASVPRADLPGQSASRDLPPSPAPGGLPALPLPRDLPPPSVRRELQESSAAGDVSASPIPRDLSESAAAGDDPSSLSGSEQTRGADAEAPEVPKMIVDNRDTRFEPKTVVDKDDDR